ncbi:MAG: ABC-F family ATP-binding cassette domain-containing protein [Bacteroidia bacterium]|nr:ABC-F family ATP-binding cassette domain-containing protein [Bacteroidia bacterium]MBP7244124.1 ABC-F family ATP-binding cassette domain-containing protein [Bacteroidia bacterium]
MFVLQQITLEFGSRVLFGDLSWHIKPNEKIGLIGANGTGKSTLLRVISGEYSPTSGDISKRNDLIIGFLNQDLLSYLSDNSILDVAMEAFERANFVHSEIEKILIQLEHDHSEEILNKLHKLQTEYDSLDGYQLQSKAEAILEGLGFTTEDLKRPLKEFSGGWRMRVMLAKTLLQKPNLLLLDEPTNHLDLPSIQWLENYLHDYEGAVIIVSHDRYFLDKIVNKIAELEYEKLTLYTGNYSDYLIEKEERKELQMNAFKNQERYIKEQEKFIERFRAKASKATAVQSRVKALEKLDKVEEVAGPLAAIKIRFAVDKQPGKIISKLNIRSKAYGSNELLKNTTAEITRGDKIAFIGANGKGKSTMLRLLAGHEEFDGEKEETYNVVETFYAQHQLESLNKEYHPLEELQMTAPDETDTYLRSLLGAFLFKGDDVFKKIKVLSGGERARVALAKVILDKANFLLLDEPTNHLDIQSVNVLVEVLNKYEGTYIVVSHDRYFLSRIANKIWYIENKELKEYPGTYHEFEIWQAEQKALKPTKSAPVTKLAKAEKATKIYPDEKNNDQNKKKEKQRLETLSKKHEEQVILLKKEHERLSLLMSDPNVFQDKIKYKNLQSEFDKCVHDLNHHEVEWEAYYLKLLELDE